MCADPYFYTKASYIIVQSILIAVHINTFENNWVLCLCYMWRSEYIHVYGFVFICVYFYAYVHVFKSIYIRISSTNVYKKGTLDSNHIMMNFILEATGITLGELFTILNNSLLKGFMKIMIRHALYGQRFLLPSMADLQLNFKSNI